MFPLRQRVSRELECSKYWDNKPTTYNLQLTLLAVDPLVARLLALTDGALGRSHDGEILLRATHLVCGQTRPTVLTRTGVQTPVHCARPHTLKHHIRSNTIKH